ncbi:hypothetical protein N9M16_04760 [Candidatus Dependentiae bacterium]|nr:hypothetical protein [Candidatus Dependentiae bacterium]
MRAKPRWGVTESVEAERARCPKTKRPPPPSPNFCAPRALE